MCTRGVWQLKTLILRYCPHGGSSRGMRYGEKSSFDGRDEFDTDSHTHTYRDFIKKEAQTFAKENEQIQIQVQTIPGKHPLCIGQYLNENEKTIDVPNKSTKDILDTVNFLRNQSGRPVHDVKKNQVRVVKSVQGEWSSDMEWPSEFKVTHHN